MCNSVDCPYDSEHIRERIVYESKELVSRNNIFLVSNALAATASGLGGMGHEDLRALIIWVMAIVNLLWLVSAYQSWYFLRALATRRNELVADARKRGEMAKEDHIEAFRQDNIDRSSLVRALRWMCLTTTHILGRWLPLIILAAWVIVLLTKYGIARTMAISGLCIIVVVLWLIEIACQHTRRQCENRQTAATDPK